MIRVQSLSFFYRPGTERENRVLSNLSFELPSGKWGILLGPSGSGKSTLLLLLAGFLHPFQGKVRIAGETLTRKSAPKIRKQLGLLLQFPENQLFCQTVFEEVACGLKSRSDPDAEIERVVKESLGKVGLSVDPEASPFHLSLGQKRKVVFASILAMKPKVLLLDEPTSGLDPRGRKELISLLRDLRGEGTTILQITHRLDEVLQDADRLFFLRRGELRLQIRMKEFLELSSGQLEEIEEFIPAPIARFQRLKTRLPSLEVRDLSYDAIAASLEKAFGNALQP